MSPSVQHSDFQGSFNPFVDELIGFTTWEGRPRTEIILQNSPVNRLFLYPSEHVSRKHGLKRLCLDNGDQCEGHWGLQGNYRVSWKVG